MDNADEFLNWMKRKMGEVGRSSTRANYRIGGLLKDTSVKYSPKSPTQAEKKSVSKASKAQWAAAKLRRSDRATSRAKPGGLMRSISFTSTNEYVEIFVAANSEAGKYAFIIHEEKGSKWFKRGIGTEKRGAQADDKFITRAISDRMPDMRAIRQNELDKSLKG